MRSHRGSTIRASDTINIWDSRMSPGLDDLEPILSSFSEKDRVGLWPLLLNKYIAKLQKSSLDYSDLVLNSPTGVSDAIKIEIELDLNRTRLFVDDHARDSNIGMLRQVLQAYALRNPTVGYCQGMNFIAAGLLRYLDDEASFWVLCIVVEVLLSEHHDKAMIGGKADTRILEDLLKERCPEMVLHLDNIDFEMSLISTQWFIPMFLHGKKIKHILKAKTDI